MSTKPRRPETMSAPRARRSRKFAAALITAGALPAACAPASQAALNLAPAPGFTTHYGPKAVAVDDWNGDMAIAPRPGAHRPAEARPAPEGPLRAPPLGPARGDDDRGRLVRPAHLQVAEHDQRGVQTRVARTGKWFAGRAATRRCSGVRDELPGHRARLRGHDAPHGHAERLWLPRERPGSHRHRAHPAAAHEVDPPTARDHAVAP